MHLHCSCRTIPGNFCFKHETLQKIIVTQQSTTHPLKMKLSSSTLNYVVMAIALVLPFFKTDIPTSDATTSTRLLGKDLLNIHLDTPRIQSDDSCSVVTCESDDEDDVQVEEVKPLKVVESKVERLDATISECEERIKIILRGASEKRLKRLKLELGLQVTVDNFI